MIIELPVRPPACSYLIERGAHRDDGCRRQGSRMAQRIGAMHARKQADLLDALLRTIGDNSRLPRFQRRKVAQHRLGPGHCAELRRRDRGRMACGLTISACTCSLMSAALSISPSDSRTRTSKARKRKARIPSEAVAQRPLPARIAVLLGPQQAVEREPAVSRIVLVGGEHAIGDEPISRIVLPFRHLDDLVGEVERRLHAGAAALLPSRARTGSETRCRSVPTPRSSSSLGGAHHLECLGCGNAFQRHQRVSARDEKRKFERVAFASFGDAGDQRQIRAGMALGLDRRRLRQCELGRTQPGGGCGRGESGLGEMMRDGGRRDIRRRSGVASAPRRSGHGCPDAGCAAASHRLRPGPARA